MDHIITPPFPRGGELPELPTVALAGELDLAAAPGMHEQLDALLAAGTSSIVVDLADATFLDSTALGVLVNALNRCQESGGQLHLVVREPQILRVLAITGLTDAFSLHNSWDELYDEMGELWK
jgi:anti-sigma B factor antagonist